MIKSKAGFTLIELMVVTIIIGILAASGLMYYGRFLERMRMAEALQLFGVAISAQERCLLQRHHYTKVWGYLDVTATQNTFGTLDTKHSNADQTHYYTNGSAETAGEGSFRPGYDMYFEEKENGKWYIVAKRIGWGGYDYTFLREFDDGKIYCIPNQDHAPSVNLCLDFMGVSTLDELPEDPRTASAGSNDKELIASSGDTTPTAGEGENSDVGTGNGEGNSDEGTSAGHTANTSDGNNTGNNGSNTANSTPANNTPGNENPATNDNSDDTGNPGNNNPGENSGNNGNGNGNGNSGNNGNGNGNSGSNNGNGNGNSGNNGNGNGNGNGNSGNSGNSGGSNNSSSGSGIWNWLCNLGLSFLC